MVITPELQIELLERRIKELERDIKLLQKVSTPINLKGNDFKETLGFSDEWELELIKAATHWHNKYVQDDGGMMFLKLETTPLPLRERFFICYYMGVLAGKELNKEE